MFESEITPRREIYLKKNLVKTMTGKEKNEIKPGFRSAWTNTAALIRQAITQADALLRDYGVNRRDRIGSTLYVRVYDWEGYRLLFKIQHGPERWAWVGVRAGEKGSFPHPFGGEPMDSNNCSLT